MAVITLTTQASTMLKEMMAEQEKGLSALRVWVQGGGCSGLSYGMAIDDGGFAPAKETPKIAFAPRLDLLSV